MKADEVAPISVDDVGLQICYLMFAINPDYKLKHRANYYGVISGKYGFECGCHHSVFL